MEDEVKARILGKRRFLLSLAVMFMIAVSIAACGTAAEPAVEESQPHPTAHVEETGDAAASGAAASVASMAPDFQLPAASGETLSLASFAGDKNVVLVFYRGFW